VGIAYYYGFGTTKDYAEAARWLLKAASQGHAESQFFLGLLYWEGRGVEKDPSKAVYWYEKAAHQGDSFGQTNLGYAYQEGEGVEKDYQKARHWSTLAAHQGNDTAQSNLGEIYRDGLGVVQDYVQAHMWFNLAASQGLEVAIQSRDELAQKMAPEQIGLAQKLAVEWKPPKPQEGRKWSLAKDIDGDGNFTIYDVTGWVGWLFFYPGDWVLSGFFSRYKGAASFFQVTPDDYGGFLSFLISLAAWIGGYIAFVGILEAFGNALDWIGEQARKVSKYVKAKWGIIRKIKTKETHDESSWL